ncbi:MAG: hypothetical protein DLM65_01480 [Candidatus Aeolococcus gillhamiae]|uniref:Short-chain dehydrogenase n=1 Tax=Candidatus Aeolococcus gillhamiae TaxID=3127015 RepID=A0A2W5ZDW7_9BACT|nr:MAG: hypothetical protein DLM65_01480 [Candidatus Dormibacter sp. RRmetagenome_bin12]
MPVADARVALVTGSSRGLGAMIARRLAHDGLAVAVNGRRDDGPAPDIARSIRDDGGVAEAFSGDVTDEQQVAELVTAITGHFGPVDVLVLNATGPQPDAPVTEVAVADELASAAELVMGKSAGIAAAVVRGVDPSWLREGSVREEVVRPHREDLFR